jgi:DNA-binding response OmpR family regulator
MIKVLIIEDNEAIRKALAEELRLDKFSVSESGDGEDGLRKVISDKPSIVILDINLPKMNGIEVLKKIRGNPEVADTKVMLFTDLEPNDKMIEEVASLNPCF